MSEQWKRRHAGVRWDGPRPVIHPSALVDPEAQLGAGVQIGAFTIVGAGAVLESNVQVKHHCLLGAVKLGTGTRVRSFVEIRNGTDIGQSCYIDSGVKSSGDVIVGNEVTVRYDAILARGVRVGDNSFIAPQVMTINLDHKGNAIGGATIGKRCHIGTAAVLHPGITIVDDVVVGAKALVTKSCEEPGTYIGIPAFLRKRPA